MLEDLIISKVRVKILQLFLSNPPGKIYHVREIVRLVDEEINAVRRELAHMEKAAMVSKEPRGNRLYYFFRKDYPLYYDLLSLVAKTVNLGYGIIKNRTKIGKIKYAMFSGDFVRFETKENQNRVDLLMVGEVVIPELSILIQKEQARRSREINYTVMSEAEFEFRKQRHDPFIVEILSGLRVMLIGDEREMLL